MIFVFVAFAHHSLPQQVPRPETTRTTGTTSTTRTPASASESRAAWLGPAGFRLTLLVSLARFELDLFASGNGGLNEHLLFPDDLGAQSDLLWGRVPSDQNQQGVALFLGQFDRHGLGTTHDCLLGLAARCGFCGGRGGGMLGAAIAVPDSGTASSIAVVRSASRDGRTRGLYP